MFFFEIGHSIIEVLQIAQVLVKADTSDYCVSLTQDSQPECPRAEKKHKFLTLVIFWD